MSTYFFAAKGISASVRNGRKPSSLMVAARHNLREIQAEQGANGHIDPKRTAGNVILVGPDNAAGVKAEADRLLVAVDTSKLKRDHVQAIEALFSLPSEFVGDADDFFNKCLAWVSASLPLPLLSAVIHNDEANQHLHVLLLPVRDGRHVGGAPVLKGEVKRLTELFFQQVGGPAGLKRGNAKLHGQVRTRAIEAILGVCEAHGVREANGPLWPILLAAIERDPLKAVLALGIDPQTLRPEADVRPIGLVQQPSKHQDLSCVGLLQKQPSSPAAKAPPAPAPSSLHTECAAKTTTEMADDWNPIPPPSPVDDCANGVDPDDVDEVVRVRDSDLDPALYNSTTGDYFQRPPPPARKQKREADEWVMAALSQRRTSKVSRMRAGAHAA
jgi:hypothetical protein